MCFCMRPQNLRVLKQIIGLGVQQQPSRLDRGPELPHESCRFESKFHMFTAKQAPFRDVRGTNCFKQFYPMESRRFNCLPLWYHALK